MDIAEKVNKKNRDEMYKRAKRTSDQNDWAEAKRLRNLVKLGCTRARADFVKENIKKHEKDPKHFWKEMQEILPGKKKKSNIFNLTDRETGRKISEENMANYINEFFSKKKF